MGEIRPKNQFLEYPFLIAYFSCQGPVPCPKIKSQVYFCPNFLLPAREIQKTAIRGPKEIFAVFGFLKKSRQKLKILENPETFSIKNNFCAYFPLSKLFCSSKQKKVRVKTKMSRSRLWSPVAGPQIFRFGHNFFLL